MERRLLLTVVLCFLILMVYQKYMQVQQEKWQAQQETEAPAEAPGDVTTPAPDTSQPVGTAEGPAPTLAPEPEAPPAPAVPCEEVVVETPLFRAVFCSHNGRPLSWRLKGYRESKSCGCPFWGGKDCAETVPDATEPVGVERIAQSDLGDLQLGLALSLGDGKRLPLHERLAPDRKRLELIKGEHAQKLRFVGTDTAGRSVERVYTFSPDSYLVRLDVTIGGLPPELHQAGMGIRLVEGVRDGDRYTFSGFMAFVDGKLEKDKKVEKKEVKAYAGDVAWAGFSSKYFINCLLPVDNPVSSVQLEEHPSVPGEDQATLVSRLVYNIQPHLQGNEGHFAFDLFIGPKDLDVLRETGHSLERSVDLGWFGFIAQPLLVALKFFYRYVHNYGIAIILMTVIIKVLFHPLTRKQYESMRAMQKLQPKMQAIREKFKNDRERMNREIMDLYRTHKINPLGGCWPMLLQIPVFFAFYRALLNSVELRHAPFMLWIQDLSAKDPCHITPIIMGATMFLQQRMTPMAGDPTQQRMMMFMPILFTFLFLNFPSGLVLYWLVNNVLTIGQQYVSQKRKG